MLTFPNGNATVTITRGGTALLTAIPAMVRAPAPENISPEGVIMTTTVLLNPLPPGLVLKTGDIMTFNSMGGHSGVGQLPKKTILSAPNAPMAAGLEALAVVRVTLDGVLQ